MYKELIDILRCPVCGKKLQLDIEEMEKDDVIKGKMFCEDSHEFNIVNGVADFGSSEQKDANSWSDYYKEQNYEEVDKAIEDSKSDKQKQIERLFIDGIIKETSRLNNGLLLDIATGRGMLLKRLIEEADSNIHIIATDLSYAVLMYDRIKFKNIAPDIRISYIACDAINLPFINSSIDMTCTFSGYMNMGDIMEKGIKEASRVLKPNSELIDSVMYMDKNSTGYQEVRSILASSNMLETADNLIRENTIAMHKRYFKELTDFITYEGIGEKTPGDILPHEGSWYANAIIICKKQQY